MKFIPMSLEIERKYLNINFTLLRERMVQCGAQGGKAHFESNLVFDTTDSYLFTQGKLLRLRTQEWVDRVSHVLTLKLPARGEDTFKVREELEICLNDNRPMLAILQGLGFNIKAQYEKIREVWHYQNVEIVLDTLPFIQVVELEGNKNDICTAEQDLHLDLAEKTTDSYHALHQAWLEVNNLPRDSSFVFEEKERDAWRKKLGLKCIGGKDAVGL